jgi:hypothetical protein
MKAASFTKKGFLQGSNPEKIIIRRPLTILSKPNRRMFVDRQKKIV